MEAQTLAEAKRTLTRETLLDALAQGASRTEACRAAGIARQTLYNWLEDDEDFQKHLLQAEQEAVQAVEAVAYRCAMKAETDPRYQPSLRFYLKAKAKWNDRPAPPEPEAPEPYEQPTRQAILTRIRTIQRRYAEAHGEEFVDSFPNEPDDPKVRADFEAKLDREDALAARTAAATAVPSRTATPPNRSDDRRHDPDPKPYEGVTVTIL